MHSHKISMNTLIKYLIYLYIFIIVTSASTGTMAVKAIRVVLAAALVLYVLRSGGFRLSAYVGWAVVFLAFNLLIIRYATYKSTAKDYTVSLIYVLVINIGIYQFITKHDITLGMMKTLIFSTIVEAIITFGRYGLLVFMATRKTDEGSANILGFYAAMSFISGLILYRKYKGNNQQFIYATACLVCFMIAFLSASRKVLIFIFVPIVVYWIISSRNPIKTFRNAIVSVIVVGGVYYAMMHINFAYELLGQRVDSLINGLLGAATDASTATRLKLIRFGMIWFREKPWFGHGLGNFRAINMAIRRSIYYAHNNYVELLVDCGIAGTVIYYWLYLRIIVSTVKNRVMERKTKGILLGVVAAFLIGDYGLVSYNLPVFQLIMLCLFVMADNRMTLTETQEEKRPAFSQQINTGGI